MKILKLSLIVIAFLAIGSLKAQELIPFQSGFFMQYYEDDTRITRQDYVSKLKGNPVSNELIQKSNRHTAIAVLGIAGQLGTAIWAGRKAEDGESLSAPIIGFIGSSIFVIGFSLSGAKLHREAILKYNASFDEVGSINLGPTQNGLGLVMEF